MGVYLIEMAAKTRKEAIESITTFFQDKITDEIIKLTVYENNTQDRTHWKSKINTYLKAIDKIKISNGGKLKRKDYLVSTNPQNYEDAEDFFLRLVKFQDDYVGSDHSKTKEYPDFDITNEDIINTCYKHWSSIRTQACEIFTSKHDKNFSFAPIVENEFNS